MEKSIDKKQYILLAGICFCIIPIISLIRRFMILSENNIPFTSGFPIGYLLYPLAFIIVAVSCFSKNEIIGIIGSAILVVLGIYWCILDAETGFYFVDFQPIPAYGSLLVLLGLLKTNSKSAISIWFLPCALCAVSFLIGWIQLDYFSNISATWPLILSGFLEIAGLALFGIDLKSSLQPNKSSITTVQDRYSVTSHDPHKIELGSADKLKEYKSLLDLGAISEEEFNRIKKQIIDN